MTPQGRRPDAIRHRSLDRARRSQLPGSDLRLLVQVSDGSSQVNGEVMKRGFFNAARAASWSIVPDRAGVELRDDLNVTRADHLLVLEGNEGTPVA